MADPSIVLPASSEIIAISVWNRNVATSVINLVPKELLTHMDAVKNLHGLQFRPDVMGTHRGDRFIERIKYAFWLEYERVVYSKRKRMNLKAIYADICSWEEFERRILGFTHVLGYVIYPDAKFRMIIEEGIYRCLERFRDILDCSVRDEKGKLIPRNAELAIKVFMLLTRGSTSARAEADGSIRTPSISSPKVDEDDDMDIDAELEQLRQDLSKPEIVFPKEDAGGKDS